MKNQRKRKTFGNSKNFHSMQLNCLWNKYDLITFAILIGISFGEIMYMKMEAMNLQLISEFR